MRKQCYNRYDKFVRVRPSTCMNSKKKKTPAITIIMRSSRNQLAGINAGMVLCESLMPRPRHCIDKSRSFLSILPLGKILVCTLKERSRDIATTRFLDIFIVFRLSSQLAISRHNDGKMFRIAANSNDASRALVFRSDTLERSSLPVSLSYRNHSSED